MNGLYQHGQGWGNQIYSYVKSASVYICPDDPTSQNNKYSSYALNADLDETDYSNALGANVLNTVKLSQFVNVAKTIVLFEVAYDYVDVTDPTKIGSNSPDGYGNSVAADGRYAPAYRGIYDTGVFGNLTNPTAFWNSSISTYNPPSQYFIGQGGRHSDGSNYLFSDGHAKWARATSIAAGYNNFTGGSDCGSKDNAAAATGCATYAGTFSIY